MFEQSFVEGTVKTNRGWPVVASSLLQVTLIGGGVLIPLLNPEMLPRTGLFSTPLASPPAAPPPKAPVLAQQAPVARKAPPRLLVEGQLYAPTRPPAPVARIVDPMDLGPSVIGGVGDGASTSTSNSFINQLVATSQRPAVVPPPPAPQAAPVKKPIERIRMGGTVLEAKIINRVIPVYPRLALQARLEGTVQFTAIIARDGTIQNLQLLSGHPLFVQAATEAVKQWRYRPTLLNGEPVEVVAPIEVKFILNR